MGLQLRSGYVAICVDVGPQLGRVVRPLIAGISHEGGCPVAGAGDKVQVMSAVRAMQSAGHDNPHGTGSIAPPLHRTQEQGTHSSGTGTKNMEGWATRPP